MIEDFPIKKRASAGSSANHSQTEEESFISVGSEASLGDRESLGRIERRSDSDSFNPSFACFLGTEERISLSASHYPATPQTANNIDESDAEGISLLKEIFPDLSTEELRHLHRNHLHSSVEKRLKGSVPTSPLGKRIWKQTVYLEQAEEHNESNSHSDSPPLNWQSSLPDDFLRLPPSVAVRCFNNSTGKLGYRLVADMERNVLREYEFGTKFEQASATAQHYTEVLFRDAHIGLGMTICEEAGCIWIHSLTGIDGTRWYDSPPANAVGGPALDQGIRPGDRVLGINGEAFLTQSPLHGSKDSLLRHAVLSIKHSQDPVVVHLRRGPPRILHPLAEKNGLTSTTPSLLDRSEYKDRSFHSDESVSNHVRDFEVPTVHPFATALASKGLIKSETDQISITHSLKQFTERTQQWESNSSFRIDASTHELINMFDPRDLPPSLSAKTLPFEYAHAKSLRPYGPSTPTLHPSFFNKQNDSIGENGTTWDHEDEFESQGLLGNDYNDLLPGSTGKNVYPGSRIKRTDTYSGPSSPPDSHSSDIFIPLMGVRKALCVRIVNTFIEENRIAYTILVHDIESGREWYAPIRYYQDFQDLRAATLPLCQSFGDIPFPVNRWNLFGGGETKEPARIRETKCRQLEHFLRRLCSAIYIEKLNPNIAEIAIHVQSFLGCDTALGELENQDLHLHIQVAVNDVDCGPSAEGGHTEVQVNARLLLKRSIQRYTYRLFLLPTMQQIVDQFVAAARARGPKIDDIKALEVQGRTTLKDISLEELAKIRAYLDQIQEMIVESCTDDLTSISERREYVALRDFMDGEKGNSYMEHLFREAVREQIEIEVYVPLRSIISRFLVNGWRHDDMEMLFKMQELRKRPQTLFRIPPEKQSPSDWQAASDILQRGVGRSTLPCAKLRAIVQAAKEISRLYGEEQPRGSKTTGSPSTTDTVTESEPDDPTLGADDFLPIFIYCVVRAEMERPCALCVLLTTLCERTGRMGETGYYLASFEAAITYIQEIDLSEDRFSLAPPTLPEFP